MKKLVHNFFGVLLGGLLIGFQLSSVAAETSSSKPAPSPQAQKVAEGSGFLVTQITYKHGEGAPMTKRPIRVVYALTAGTLTRTYEDGTKADISFKKGETKIIQEERPYSFVNLGKAPLTLYIVRNSGS
jgi:mannose-6-phosphate isomerase-like protein (cupin superfamily)